MGFFKGIKDTYKKSEAAVIVQNLLDEVAKVGLFSGDASKTANILVGAVWDSMPEIFGGAYGQRPHKITVAASALANAIVIDDAGKPGSMSFILAISLGKIMNEVGLRGDLYPFNSLDARLLDSAAQVFTEFSSKLSDSPLMKELQGDFV